MVRRLRWTGSTDARTIRAAGIKPRIDEGGGAYKHCDAPE
jgi:hypothetical protein